MDLILKELMLEECCVEKVQYRRRKIILIAYRGLGVFLIERRFEVLVNVIIFKQVIQNAIVRDISEEISLRLIRAGLVITNVNVWKTFIFARDSSNNIGIAMKSTQKTAMTKDKKETQTKATKKPRKEYVSNLEV